MKIHIDIDQFEEIWHTISRNKVRSILTAFGVFWGIFMLVVMSGSGYGLQTGILSRVQNFAQNSCFFLSNTTLEPYKGYRKGRYWEMHTGDVEAIANRIPEVKIVVPILFGNWRDKNTVYKDRFGTYNIKGLDPMYNKVDPQDLMYGRYINNIDMVQRRKVCVIGKKVYEDLFAKGQNPLGEQIRVNGIYYTIIGVNIPLSDVNINGRSEEGIIFPYTTLQQTENRGDIAHALAVVAYNNVKMSDIEEQIKTILKERNSISPTDPQAVMSISVEKQFTMFNNLFLGINVLIWIVGIGTLLAGVVGISNIMLVTVRERTKEIGIRRALGAPPRTILIQIMSESLLLTLLSGFLGMGAGIALLQVVSNVIASVPSSGSTFFESPQIPFDTAVIAATVLLISGILAGLLPAWRALQIKAIDAIREEN